MLTTAGQKDLYNLGSRLRKDYVGGESILSNPPKLSEIEARSTRVGRNIKSLRSLVAGLTKGQVNGPLVVSSMAFENEVLFPNPKTFTNVPFDEGTEELRNDSSLFALKKKIREALKVDRLVDELDNDEKKYSKDCQVYYVRDDYIARKHNGFPIPEALDALQSEMDHYGAVELLSELLGKREDWVANLPVNIGPVLYIILSKMHKYASIPPLQLFAVHDSTILPMLLTLDSCDEMWPPFGADITFELYIQTLGPSYHRAHLNDALVYPDNAPHSHLDWSTMQASRMWVRVCYLGRPLPLASMWCAGDDAVQQLTGSEEYVPLLDFVGKLTPLALSMKDFRAKCQAFAVKANPGGVKEAKRGPKNLLLNKVTPDNFFSSVKSILAIHVESPDVLEVFVQLIFQKAANEPNFTYLYSQLCVVLCERARNFEPENAYSTFKLLLLKRCENEFFKRQSIDFTNSVARQRCIGAVRFIAHLGYIKAIPDKILHDCVKALLLCKQTGKSDGVALPPPQEGTSSTTVYPKENEHVALDMECLCEFMKIAGSYMDSPKARNLMDQYFERIAQIVERASPERMRKSGSERKFIPLSTRTRFILLDIIDLRKNKWRPLFEGQIADYDQPWLLPDLREAIDRGSNSTSSRNCASRTASGSRSVLGHFPGILEPEGDWTTLNQMGKALCSRGKDIDLFSSTDSASLSTTSYRNRDSGYSSGGGGANTSHNRTAASAGSCVSNDGNYGGNNECSGSWTRRRFAERRPYRSHQSPNLGNLYCQGPTAAVAGLNSASLFESECLQPAQKASESQEALTSCASSAAVTPATASPDLDAMMTGRTDVRQLTGGLWRPPVMRPSPPLPRQQLHQAPLAVITYVEKQAPIDENKEAARTMIGILTKTKSIQEAIDQLKEKDLFSRLNREVILKSILLLSDATSTIYSMDRQSKHTACQLASLLQYSQSQPQSDHIITALDSAWPRVLQCLSAASPKTALAFLTARLILTGCLSLTRVAEPLSSGRHHPLFLLILQQLAQMAASRASPGQFLLMKDEENEKKDVQEVEDGDFIPEGVTLAESSVDRRAQLVKMFAESNVVLEKMLPEGSQSPKRMLELLQERGIDFFLPCFRLVVETLCPLLTSGEDLRTFANHLPSLKGHLSAEVVHSLMGAAFERARVAGSSVTSSTDRDEVEEAEAAAWCAMTAEGQLHRCVLPERQMDVLHALQVFWNDKGKPKGFVLRCFQNLYEFDLVEKAAFLAWREEVDQNYPAKGQALFEVMRWLHWLETVEDVDESDDNAGGNAGGPEIGAPSGGTDMSTVDYVNGDGDNADGVADA
uniref:Eukaryotic translation initiation factor 4 gamma 2 n=1 Tax=Echinococcus canadensis TaxID=519352 RepID=A0A915EYC7_9CEST